MGYSVTSSFIAQSRNRAPEVVRQFTIASSDYSDRVAKWPVFTRTWDEIRPKTLKIVCANGDKAMNFLRDDKTLLQNQAVVKMGFGNSKTELVTNGTFDADTDWTKGADWTITGGQAVMASTSTYNSLNQNLITIIGESYTLEFDLIAVTNTIKLEVAGDIVEYNITGRKRHTFTANSTSQNIAWARLTQPSAMTIDNVSVKQLENIDLFTGKMRGVAYEDERCIISIVDKFQQLSERKVGDGDATVDYLGSNYLPSDIAWWVVTSYGGYDVTASSANTDIDYPAFEAWAKVFSQDTVFVQGTFKGQKCTEVLRKIARHTHSAIFIKEDKLSFHRFGIIDATVSSIGPSEIVDMRLAFDTNDIINQQFVAGDYDTTSKFHKFTVLDQNAASVNSFGAKDNLLKDDSFWYVDSASAINMAQRRILANAAPDDRVTIKTGLVGLPRVIGETLTVLDVFHGITEAYRVLEHTINMDTGMTNFKIDRTQITDPFILDTSSLGSLTDVLS